MSLRDCASIDKNFSIPKEIARKDCIYHDATTLDLYGVQYIDGIYRRMPYDVAKRISDPVALISTECAGGRVRFSTNSPYIAIYAKYKSVAKVPNYAYTATLGFDLYSGTRYVGAFVPPIDTTEYLESVIEVSPTEETQEYTINFPVCSEIEAFFVGVKEGSIMQGGRKYAIEIHD